MFNFTIPRVRTFLSATINIKPRQTFYRSVNQNFYRWLQDVTRHMQPSLLPSSDGYPWCFVSSADTISQRHIIVGAFLPAWQSLENRPVALYSLIKKEHTLRILQHVRNETLPFYLMRILAILDARKEQEKNNKYLSSWLQSFIYSLPIKRCAKSSIYANGKHWKIDTLSEQYCDYDFRCQSDDGLNVMPWLDWPNCINSQKKIWLWRQARNAKVLESQKISLAGFK